MTIVEQLRQEGEQRGIQLGCQEGQQEGEKLASLKIAKHMLASGLTRNTIKQFTGLADQELDGLTRQ